MLTLGILVFKDALFTTISYKYVNILNLLYTVIGGENLLLFACFINVMGGTFFFSGLPYSMKQAGFPLGILLFILGFICYR